MLILSSFVLMYVDVDIACFSISPPTVPGPSATSLPGTNCLVKAGLQYIKTLWLGEPLRLWCFSTKCMQRLEG